ncbi:MULTISPECIES: aldo/keto reductase [Cyanophyceae]|nr:aldo/keto reductase [Nodosilinea sp. FACHB-141]MBD2111787.1 aldo/keto reductase [Nodosilinea sp. FACHB-141]
MKLVSLPSGQSVPALGQGTWKMGENHAQRQAEVAALRLGLDLGMTLIDTAEMYGEGGAEKVVGEAIAGRRDEVFLVSKVYPHNATRQGVVEACDRSLKRLQTDSLDLYLLHWRGAVPLTETLAGLQSLKQAGKIQSYGVSNFDRNDMEEAIALPGGDEIVTNQVLYNLMNRGIEWDLLPWSRDRNIPTMAYSPVGHSPAEQKGLFQNSQLKAIADRHRATPTQVALAWLLHQEGMIAIPKATNPDHIQENRAALELTLTTSDLTELDRIFPPPRRKTSLAMR